MKSKTNKNIAMSLGLILLLVLLLWKFFQREQQVLLTLECGKKLSLDSSQLFTPKQLTETSAEFIKRSNSKLFSYQNLSKHIECFRHAELYSQGYFIRNEQGKNILIQAVHAHDDLYTGELVKLMSQLKESARFSTISSVSRSLLDPSTQASLSNSIALSLLKSDTIDTIVQIHGFSQEKRKSRKAKSANIIISSGSKDSHRKVSAIYKCLDNQFDKVFLFGKNIYELGATENYLNKSLQNSGFDENFVHIELSLEQRKKLLNPTTLEQFNQCLSHGVNYAFND